MYASSPRPFGRPFGVIVALVGLWTGVAAAAFTTFESGQVRPLAMSPDGTRLFAVNTPDNRLEIFTSDGRRAGPHRLGAGRPRAGRRRGADERRGLGGEPPLRLRQHRRRRDQPAARHAHPAGRRRAARHRVRRPRAGTAPSSPRRTAGRTASVAPQLTTAGVERAPTSGSSTPPTSARPRRNAAHHRRRCSATRRARSRSRPTAARSTPPSSTPATGRPRCRRALVCNGGAGAAPCTVERRRACRAACRLPNTNFQGIAQPEVGLIVKFNASVNHWRDELGRNWNNAVRFTLPDNDVFAINANAGTPAQTAFFAGVGTVLFNMVANPVSGKVYVSNTDARNEVRFEGPGDVRAAPPCAAICTRRASPCSTARTCCRGTSTSTSTTPWCPRRPAERRRAWRRRWAWR